MRILCAALVGISSTCGLAHSASEPSGPSSALEVVKTHVEVEVSHGGGYIESREVVYRVLSEAGAQALRQITLSYTQGYQSYAIGVAYTLKANGTRIDVDPRNVLKGFGATNNPGFQDLKTMTVVFPNLEVGDEVVLTTIFNQIVPWFGNQYSEVFTFSRLYSSRDITVAITAPLDMPIEVDAVAMSGGQPEILNGKARRVWRFTSQNPSTAEQDDVDGFDTGPRVVVSSFPDYRSFAAVYAGMLKDRADITPEIRELADKVTGGLKGDREQARALYEWVSLHIAYLDIILGAGGFVPHRASEVLANKYGDCKDHVILLQALLAAKGITSSPVLINADNRYSLALAPTPFAFNHLVTYLPNLHLYLDSTARYTPFGSLPFQDADKPVVRIASLDTARTPRISPDLASVTAVETVNIAPDGSIEGAANIIAKGSTATDVRGLMAAALSIGDTEYLQRTIGPGAEGNIDRGDVNSLTDTYSFSVHYRQANAINSPGPAAIPVNIAYRPFSITNLLAGHLPQTRTQEYVCPSMTAEEDVTLRFPTNLKVTFVPAGFSLAADGVALTVAYTQPSPGSILESIHARVDHPGATCSPAYYARVRGTLAQMVAALRSPILYQ